MGAIELVDNGLGHEVMTKDQALLLERWVESEHCYSLAAKKVQLDHPTLLSCESSVDAAWDPGDQLMRVFAMGSMPNYTRLHLAALLNEFVNFVRSKGDLLPPGVTIRVATYPDMPVQVPKYSVLAISVWWCLGTGLGCLGGLLVSLLAKMWFGKLAQAL